jgi:hypothetical protein
LISGWLIMFFTQRAHNLNMDFENKGYLMECVCAFITEIKKGCRKQTLLT